MNPSRFAAALASACSWAARGASFPVIDAAARTVVATIALGEGMRPMGTARDGKTLYTANGPSNDVSIIDVATRSVTRAFPIGTGPWGALVIEG